MCTGEYEGSLGYIHNSLIIEGRVDVEVVVDVNVDNNSSFVVERKGLVTFVSYRVVLNGVWDYVEVGSRSVVEGSSLVKSDTRGSVIIYVSIVNNRYVSDVLNSSSVEVTCAWISKNYVWSICCCCTDRSSSSTPNEWIWNVNLSS